MTLTITPVDELDAITRWQQVVAASFETDHVGLPAAPVEEIAVDLAGQHADERVVLWLGEVAGEPVAAGRLSLPVRDNTDKAMLDVHVRPDRRRSGYGLAAAQHGLGLVAREGRRVVHAEVWSPLENGAPGAPTAVAQRLGMRPVLEEVRRVLDLTTLDLEQVERCRAQAALAARGYEVVQWVDGAPAVLHEDLARLSRLMSTDPPMGEMSWEPEVWDAARWRQGEERIRAKRSVEVGSAAVHVATGRAVGYSTIGVSTLQPGVGNQWATIVEGAHRGHRLGLLMKAANLQLLTGALPRTELVNTWNAAVNTHMIGINEALGFRPVERWTEWQLDR